MNGWKVDRPGPYIGGAATLFVLGLFVTQFVTVHLVRLMAGTHPHDRMTFFTYLGLWGTDQPGRRDGAPGWDVVHWIVLSCCVAFCIAIPTAIQIARLRHKRNPEYLPGTASIGDVVKHAGRKQLMRRASGLRPLLSNPTPDDVGFLIATYRRTEVWVSVEDPMILVGPSRSGKGFYFVVEMIIKAPGAVVTTSCKVDNVKVTLAARESDGRTALIFAPGVDSAAGLGHELRWNPIEGCADPETLERRMSALIPKDSYGSGTTNGGHWDILGQQLAAALFHAAALGNKTVDDMWGWVVNVVKAQEAYDIISAHPAGMPEHADRLAAVLNAEPRERETNWATLATVLAWMGSRSVRQWLKPTNEEQFDIPRFLLNRGTLYLVGNEDGSGGYQQVVGALVAEIDYVAEGIAAAMPGSRLDPSVTFILDEAANFHIATLPKLISAGGGVGRQVLAVFQSRSQMAAWGAENERSMWDAAAIKIVLPGGSDEQDLRALSALVGDHKTTKESVTHSDNGGSLSWSEQELTILTASEIRTLPKGTALIFHREMKPIVGRLTSWLLLSGAEQMKESEKALSKSLRASSQYSELVNAHLVKAGQDPHA